MIAIGEAKTVTQPLLGVAACYRTRVAARVSEWTGVAGVDYGELLRVLRFSGYLLEPHKPPACGATIPFH